MSSTTQRQSTLDYRPAIDGLRALAVLSVFVFHLNRDWLPGGFVGVDVFFVISGFLITSIIFKECNDNSFQLGNFYQRRIARICPAFFTVAIATLVGACFIYSPQDLAFAGTNLSAAALCVENLASMLDQNYFQNTSDSTPYMHYWSLSVEEQFYIFFPLLFLLLFKHDRKNLLLWLGVLWVTSFASCVIITHWKPVWAFFLLVTRAFELLAGCILAVMAGAARCEVRPHWPHWLSAAGLGMIGLSFFMVQEGPSFPGFWPLLPIIGAVSVLAPPGKTRGISERFLAATPLVLVGRMSYSLYLWHWPVFSLVDYKLYLASEPVRLSLKVGVSFFAAALSFLFIEKPARTFLNRSNNRTLACSLVFCLLALCVPLGIAVRKTNYMNAWFRTVAHGGLVFETKNQTGSVVLMGDSNGTMYGKTLKEICAELDCKLTIISVYRGTPLPLNNGSYRQLWLDSLAVVQKERPDCLILACRWETVLNSDKECLTPAVAALKPLVGHLVILNQPPILPANANRAAIRNGARPPFFEEPKAQALRFEANDSLKQFNGGNVSVVDVASHFQTTNGKILFFNNQGQALYYDAYHLSGYGTDFVRSELKQAVSESTHISSFHAVAP